MKRVGCFAIMLSLVFNFVMSCSPLPSTTPFVATVMVSPGRGLQPASGAFANHEYRNLFKEYLGKSDADIKTRLETIWQQLFYGNDNSERVYYPVGDDMAYIEDIGNSDVRTEGMSYGMMIAVQLDKQAEFNRLWKWAHLYAWQFVKLISDRDKHLLLMKLSDSLSNWSYYG